MSYGRQRAGIVHRGGCPCKSAKKTRCSIQATASKSMRNKIYAYLLAPYCVLMVECCL